MDSGKVRFIVSQNVDCLHLRSGVPRAKLAELVRPWCNPLSLLGMSLLRWSSPPARSFAMLL